MKLARVVSGLSIYIDREWDCLAGRDETKGGELIRLYNEVLVCGVNEASEEGEGDAQLIEGEYTGHWVWCYRNEYHALSPLELLAREAE